MKCSMCFIFFVTTLSALSAFHTTKLEAPAASWLWHMGTETKIQPISSDRSKQNDYYTNYTIDNQLDNT